MYNFFAKNAAAVCQDPKSMRKYHKGMMTPPVIAPVDIKSPLSNFFKNFDTNGDGQLIPVGIKEMFLGLDVDENNRLSNEEFTKPMEVSMLGLCYARSTNMQLKPKMKPKGKGKAGKK